VATNVIAAGTIPLQPLIPLDYQACLRGLSKKGRNNPGRIRRARRASDETECWSIPHTVCTSAPRLIVSNTCLVEATSFRVKAKRPPARKFLLAVSQYECKRLEFEPNVNQMICRKILHRHKGIVNANANASVFFKIDTRTQRIVLEYRYGS
jgi:hypothetical protein